MRVERRGLSNIDMCRGVMVLGKEACSEYGWTCIRLGCFG